jgi:hypothetical protein
VINDENEVFAVIEAEFPEEKLDTLFISYTDENGRRGCNIAFSDLKKCGIPKIKSVILILINYYVIEDIKSKIKEAILKLDFVEVPEFQGKEMNGALYCLKWDENRKYSIFFEESSIRFLLEEEDKSNYYDIDYSFFCKLESMLCENHKDSEKKITPEIAVFGTILYYMFKLDGVVE